jgi:hypothetical protein
VDTHGGGGIITTSFPNSLSTLRKNSPAALTRGVRVVSPAKAKGCPGSKMLRNTAFSSSLYPGMAPTPTVLLALLESVHPRMGSQAVWSTDELVGSLEMAVVAAAASEYVGGGTALFPDASKYVTPPEASLEIAFCSVT